MVLSMPVFHPRQPNTVLLKAGIALDDWLIGRMRDNLVREVYIQYPKLEFLAEYVSPSVMAAREHVAEVLGEAFNDLSGDVAAELDYFRYRAGVVSLLEKLAENPRAALFIDEMAEHDRPLLQHSTAVCYLSVLMGLRLEPYLVLERGRLAASAARDVAPLGVGAMLHDVGMLRLDPETLRRWDATRNEADPAWREHVRLGYDLVKGRIDPSAAVAVLHHHQRYDGSGFPDARSFQGEPVPLAGQEIHIFPRVVAVADAFDRARTTPTGARVPIVRALKRTLLGPGRGGLDPIVLRALAAVVPPYAPGTIVELSDRTSGVVTAWRPTDPCSPTIAPIIQPGDRMDIDLDACIDLREREDLCVARVDGQDVRADNFYPRTAGEFDLDRTLKALTNAAVDEDEPPAKARAG